MKNITGRVEYWGKYRLEIVPTGFTLWDIEKRQWILDASCIAEDDRFEVGSDANSVVKKMRVPKGTNHVFETRHKIKVAKKTSNNKRMPKRPKGKVK